MQLVFIIGIVQKSISAKVIIGNIGRVRSKTMTEAGYARILLDKKDTQIMGLESKITKLRIEYERQIKTLQQENAELKADNDARKFAMVMSEKVEKQLLVKAEEIIKRLIKATYGEGWNYSLQVKVEAEQFLKECE